MCRALDVSAIATALPFPGIHAGSVTLTPVDVKGEHKKENET